MSISNAEHWSDRQPSQNEEPEEKLVFQEPIVAIKPPAVKKDSPLGRIAKDIAKLTWMEAEAQGKGIEEKMGQGKLSLTAAIQAWADEYEEQSDG